MNENPLSRSGEGLDVVIVGAGFSGLQMLYRTRELGLSAVVFEAGGDVGGTWYWNRYPGARCDVESLEYSYQFSDELQQEWEWTERFPSQPEILRYVSHVADRFGLRRDIRFSTRVAAAVYDEAADRWVVRTDGGDEVTARFLIMATGCLSSANLPGFPGRETFLGELYHTGRWPHEGVDLGGKRVGIIGTGSSGVQAIPVIARQAAELYVFQRTATYTLPAGNRPLDPAEQAAIKADYAGFRARNNLMPAAGNSRFPANPMSIFDATPEEREAAFEERWARGGPGFLGAFGDIMTNKQANDIAAEFVRDKIRAIVRDPAVAALLSPRHVIGCKRICLDTGYYETFNRPGVHLVDVASAPIEALTPGGIRTSVGDYELDVIVFATGFDAMTGALLSIDIRGRGGLELRQKWSAGPRTYLGLGVPGFPNMFTITGPGSPSVLTNMLASIHQHVNWIGDCLGYLQDHDVDSIEATPEAEQAWVNHVNEVAGQTLYPSCNSWYLGANVPGKTRVFMPLIGFPPYVETCVKVASNDYEGFALKHGRPAAGREGPRARQYGRGWPMTDVATRPPLDAEVAAVFDALPPDSRWKRRSVDDLPSLADRRARMMTDSLSDDDLRHGGAIEVEERLIPGPAGEPDIPTLILHPAGRPGLAPGIYYLHGSGAVMPGNRTMLSTEELGWVVGLGARLISIDYRVAPENPYPASVEDCYQGLTWTVEHAAELGIDPDRLVLVGSSAGGGLAAATALLSRDRRGPSVSRQMLLSPMLDDREATTSSGFEGVVWDRASNSNGWTALLGHARGGPEVSPYAAPARAADLSGLPPAYLDCGSAEVFRDETMNYAAELARAGVPVELHVWAGAMHYTERIAPGTEVAKAIVAARISYLRRALRLFRG